MRSRALIAAFALAAIAAPHPAAAQWSTPGDVNTAAQVVTTWVTDQFKAFTAFFDDSLRRQTAEQTATAQAQTEAAKQIADAEQRLADLRNRKAMAASITDSQRITPENARIYCTSVLDGNQTGAQAAVMAALQGKNNDRFTDRSRSMRPAQAQAASAFEDYRANYCDPVAAAQGVCTVPAKPEYVNADIKSDTVFNRQFHDQRTAEAAQRFAETLADPVPAYAVAPREAMSSEPARQKFLMERNQSARASLVAGFFTDVNARSTPSATATPAQVAAMQAVGQTPGASPQVSWKQTMESLVARRFGNDTYFTTGMARDRSPGALLIELNQQAALSNRLLWEQYLLLQRIGGVIAAGSATQIVSTPAATTSAAR